MTRAATIEELEPLLDCCRKGKLFEVQDWVKQGRPIALPQGSPAKLARYCPLRVAMDSGFHSLVQVLLEAGAPMTEPGYAALFHAVTLRRSDLAKLLIDRGADVNEVPLGYVIEAWDRDLVELFIAKGASLTKDHPIAAGLVSKIRPALGLLKKYGSDRPELMKQAALALRHHANEGNAKWVALLLWAGADPWARGPERLEDADDDSDDPDMYQSAAELAVRRGKIDMVAQMKRYLKPDPARPEAIKLLESACYADDSEVLSLLMSLGHRPTQLADGGTQVINSLLSTMTWDFGTLSYSLWSSRRHAKDIDTSRAREKMKMLHLFVARGARWLPGDRNRIGDARRDLLKMKPDYAMEFAWVMKEYQAARRRDVEELFRTPSMKALVARQQENVERLIRALPDEPPSPSIDA